MKTCTRQALFVAIAAVMLPTIGFATDGTVSLIWSPLSSTVASPGQSVTFSLQMVATGFTGSDKVAGYDYALISLNDSSGLFYIQSRTISPTSPFDDPVTSDADATTRPSASLDPYNNKDLGAAPTRGFLDAVGDGTYTLQTLVIGLDPGIAPGTYDFTTLRRLDGILGYIWSDEKGNDFLFDQGPQFSITVVPGANTLVVPEPTILALLSFTFVGCFGLGLMRGRRRSR